MLNSLRHRFRKQESRSTDSESQKPSFHTVVAYIPGEAGQRIQTRDLQINVCDLATEEDGSIRSDIIQGVMLVYYKDGTRLALKLDAATLTLNSKKAGGTE